MRRPIRSPRLATLCLQGNTADSTKDNPARIAILSEALSHLREQRDWHPLDAVLLPGGYFRLSRTLGALPFEQRKRQLEQEPFASSIGDQLEQLQCLSPGLRLVVGVMATPRHKAERTEQACIAFGREGVIGLARKMFPTTAEGRGRRYMSPCIDDFSSKHRFVTLSNGSLALLNSCYDLFGAADGITTIGSRRLAIRALRQGKNHVTHRDAGFSSVRHLALSAWSSLVTEQQPDVLLASIHAFERPGLDGYWQRHGIARASAGFKGALALGAAHFLERLPDDGSTLAAMGVPRSALSAGVNRRAFSLAAARALAWRTQQGPSILLRLFAARQRRAGR
jgi:hypothetical protein